MSLEATGSGSGLRGTSPVSRHASSRLLWNEEDDAAFASPVRVPRSLSTSRAVTLASLPSSTATSMADRGDDGRAFALPAAASPTITALLMTRNVHGGAPLVTTAVAQQARVGARAAAPAYSAALQGVHVSQRRAVDAPAIVIPFLPEVLPRVVADAAVTYGADFTRLGSVALAQLPASACMHLDFAAPVPWCMRACARARAYGVLLCRVRVGGRRKSHQARRKSQGSWARPPCVGVPGPH
jgi:hypothetical protein